MLNKQQKQENKTLNTGVDILQSKVKEWENKLQDTQAAITVHSSGVGEYSAAKVIVLERELFLLEALISQANSCVDVLKSNLS